MTDENKSALERITALYLGSPWKNTLLLSLGGGALIGAKGVWSPSILAASGTIGLMADAIVHVAKKRKQEDWMALTCGLEQVLDADYFKFVVDEVKQERGFRGQPNTVQLNERQMGTGIFQEGYLSELNLIFPGEGKHRLFYKYNAKQSLENGIVVTELLRDEGFTFVPRIYAPKVTWTSLGHNYRVRGQVYEFIDGHELEKSSVPGENSQISNDSIGRVVKQIFDQMNQVYETFTSSHNPGLSSFLFHDKLMSKLGDNSFVEEYDSEFLDATEEMPIQLVHGDLHQGNVLLSDSENCIIDWDNAHLSHPYFDFFHFSVLSDFERQDDFASLQGKFLDSHPIDESLQHLFEFEVYASLLDRYFTSAEQGILKPDCVDNIKSSCKYLLARATESINKYSRAGGSSMNQTWIEFSEQRYGSLQTMPLDMRASVAYAHTQNHSNRKVSVEETAHHNSDRHRERVESLVVSTEEKKTQEPLMLILNAYTSLTFMGALTYATSEGSWYKAAEFLDDPLVQGCFGIMGVALGMSYAKYKCDRINYWKDQIFGGIKKGFESITKGGSSTR